MRRVAMLCASVLMSCACSTVPVRVMPPLADVPASLAVIPPEGLPPASSGTKAALMSNRVESGKAYARVRQQVINLLGWIEAQRVARDEAHRAEKPDAPAR